MSRFTKTVISRLTPRMADFRVIIPVVLSTAVASGTAIGWAYELKAQAVEESRQYTDLKYETLNVTLENMKEDVTYLRGRMDAASDDLRAIRAILEREQ